MRVNAPTSKIWMVFGVGEEEEEENTIYICSRKAVDLSTSTLSTPNIILPRPVFDTSLATNMWIKGIQKMWQIEEKNLVNNKFSHFLIGPISTKYETQLVTSLSPIPRGQIKFYFS